VKITLKKDKDIFRHKKLKEFIPSRPAIIRNEKGL